MKSITNRHAAMAIFAVVLLCGLESTAFAQPGDDDVELYAHANILTMNPAQPNASAMAVKNGKIVAIGDLLSVKDTVGTDYEYYDLYGATVVPGFIETHEHMVMQGGILAWADLTPATTQNRDEALAKLRHQDPDENGWILGFGVEPLLYEGEEGRPTWRQSLDKVSKEVPVFAVHNSGHAAYANTKAFEAAGITKDTANPMGGEFVKDEDGELEGYINGRPAWLMLRGFPPQTRESTRRAAGIRAERGITTASELAIMAPQVLQHIEEVTSEPDFKVRLVGGMFITMPGLDEVAPQARNFETDLFKVKFIKSWADGSIQGGTGAMTEGYYDFDRAAESGLTDTQEGFNAQVLKMYELGFWPALHANGDAAMDMALKAIKHAREQTGNRKIRPQLIHCQYVRTEQFDLIKEIGATMTFFATHIYNYGDLHRDRFLGPERGPRISSLKVAFEKGISAAMHDDAPVALPDPLFNMWVSVNRKTRSDNDLGPELRLTSEQALAAYTREAAYQFGMEDEAGTLEKGKFADFVVLAENPLKVAPDHIKDIRILATVMDGRITHLADQFYSGSPNP